MRPRFIATGKFYSHWDWDLSRLGNSIDARPRLCETAKYYGFETETDRDWFNMSRPRLFRESRWSLGYKRSKILLRLGEGSHEKLSIFFKNLPREDQLHHFITSLYHYNSLHKSCLPRFFDNPFFQSKTFLFYPAFVLFYNLRDISHPIKSEHFSQFIHSTYRLILVYPQPNLSLGYFEYHADHLFRSPEEIHHLISLAN